MKKTLIAVMAALVMAGCTANKEKKENPVQEEPTATEAQTTVAAEGQTVPDFTLNDPEGKPFTLSSLRGKYVVLDFWGTWCKWCVKGIPDMKACYEKYNGMFEMVSIDFGDEEDTWLKAIEQYDMPWRHVIATADDAPVLEEQFAIEGFPTKMVIDPKGTIVHITVGEDPAFYKFIDDLFGGK